MKGIKKEELGWDLRLWEGAVKKERFPHTGNPLHQLGDQPRQTGSFRGLEGSAPAGLPQAEQRDTSTDSPGSLAALTSRDIHLPTWPGSRMLKLRLQQTDPEKGLSLDAWRQPKGPGVWSGLQLGVGAGWSRGPPKEPHCQCTHERGALPHHSSLILGVLTPHMALPIRALGARTH